ncbi:hypothetical protein KFL_004810130 [Klebsormidium nitens]|uniref:Acetyltransferase component of pyruvate dehydrogenase complex n=1 Tax=Klebsormidium nitens TaxID=105231 RepID=A0A1Y1IDP2_KLENI|nr:hypothetical protein KFL_004810130 [Klebsormidium nitens]|eukprot:GAQ89040.1 hypothetical protein KFL_004810130 [Klebsormidium nitens]
MASRRVLQLVARAGKPARALLVGHEQTVRLLPEQCAECSRGIRLLQTQAGLLEGAHASVARLGVVSSSCSIAQPSQASSALGSQNLGVRLFSAAADYPPHEQITMPSLSPTMEKGNIATWKAKVGDQLAPGDVLCDIETDKATLDMEVQEEGYLAKILMPEGAKDVPVGQPIAILVEDKADIDKFADFEAGAAPAPTKSESKEEAEPKEEAASPPPPPPKESAPAPPKKEAPKPPKQETQKSAPPAKGSEGRVLASPAARKLASEKGIDLSQVKGTGLDGVIVRADVEEFQAPEPSKTAPSAAPAAAAAPGAAPPLESIDYTDISNSQIRKITASRLLQSKQTIPHYYLSSEVRVDKLLELRAKLNKAQEATGGKKISLNDFVIKAAALAMKKHPGVNSSWTDDFIRQYKNVDISVAVQTDNGLMVPVVKDADKKGLGTISENVKVLAEQARANKLAPSEFQGGTFTISNLGMYGIKQFCAIINPPQAAILAVGTTEKRVLPPGPAEETFGTGTYMTVTLSCDHRIIDGAMGAEWMGSFKGYMEDPITMIL